MLWNGSKIVGMGIGWVYKRLSPKTECEWEHLEAICIQVKSEELRKCIWIVSPVRYLVVKVDEFLFSILIKTSIGILFFHPNGNFISALEERGCLFIKEKTDMLRDVKTVFMPYTPLIWLISTGIERPEFWDWLFTA